MNITTTRPRDFYDVYVLNIKSINQQNLKTALEMTCKHRGAEKVLAQIKEITSAIRESDILKISGRSIERKCLVLQKSISVRP